MKNFLIVFFVFTIFPLTLSANEIMQAEMDFDQLPIAESEASRVTHLFWNAQSIQDKIRENLPQQVRSKFTPKSESQGCEIKSVFKTEGSADTCELNDDPERTAKFIYNFNLACHFGSYQVSICSREESKLLNQLKVTNPERLVSDDEILDWDSKI
jgi:hypothetical protein